MSDLSPSELHVRIGQVKIGRPGQTLSAILGSCVGIGFLLKKREIYGLAHCLLPKSANAEVRTGDGRHVDQAIATLLKKMDIVDAERRDLRVVLAGGANMTMPVDTPASRLVGSTNAQFARETLRAKRLRLLDEDLGGTNGRRVIIDCNTGEHRILSIPRLEGA